MLRRLFLVSALLYAASACGRPSSAPTPTGAPASVEVTNNFALPVDIYAVGSGITQRIGTVHPGMSGHFVVPPTLVGNGSVEFQARTNTQTYRSGPTLLAPGRVVDFMIAPQLFNSTVTIRP